MSNTISTVLTMFRSDVVSRETILSKTVGIGRLQYKAIKDYSIPTNTTDFEVSFDSVTEAKILLIESDQDISYKINGASDAVPMTAGGYALLFGTTVDELTITNVSGNIAKVTLMLFGPQDD